MPTTVNTSAISTPNAIQSNLPISNNLSKVKLLGEARCVNMFAHIVVKLGTDLAKTPFGDLLEGGEADFVVDDCNERSEPIEPAESRPGFKS